MVFILSSYIYDLSLNSNLNNLTHPIMWRGKTNKYSKVSSSIIFIMKSAGNPAI